MKKGAERSDGRSGYSCQKLAQWNAIITELHDVSVRHLAKMASTSGTSLLYFVSSHSSAYKTEQSSAHE